MIPVAFEFACDHSGVSQHRASLKLYWSGPAAAAASPNVCRRAALRGQVASGRGRAYEQEFQTTVPIELAPATLALNAVGNDALNGAECRQMAENKVPARRVPKTFMWRLTRASVPRHELEFISKMGGINRDEAAALLQKHMGDREAVFRELASHRKP